MLTLALLLIAFMIVPALMGLLVFTNIFIMNKKPPMDESNRINHLRLIWWAITKPHTFVHLYPWLKNDEGENVESEPRL